MGRFLPCPLPCNSDKHQDCDHQSQTNLQSDSSSNSSLTSQLSLPSVPSLEHATTSSAAAAHCIATLKGHSSYIFSLALAGKHLYSGSSDGEIRAWDRHNTSTTVSQGHSAVKSIVVIGDKLITGHSDHRIRVWKIDNAAANNIHRIKLISTLPTVNDRCMRLFSAKNYVQVRRHKKRTWVHHVDAVAALATSADGALLYSVSWDRSMKIWRSSDFKCVESVQNAHDDAINAVVAGVDGHIYTGSADKVIKVWKKRDGEKRHSLVSTLEKHRSAVNALALSTDGNVLYSGACDRSIIVWEKSGGGGSMAVAGALRGHKKAILCLAMVADLLCSGSGDTSVRVWRRGSGNSYSCLAVFQGHKSPVKCLVATFDPNKINDVHNLGNSYQLYSGGLDFDIKVWKIWVPF
ncbi:Transducin/WD40 repeat-like superfamily protein [Perilla frutescens var. hirtella]|uniref:Transducin/WD40 repeat-like superfamily protein n=1 Tax=Perilla frutescens var. hirtella TaxID=608512 RepID=A0AAD4IW15_PERFH|nr:Transducin/WD40 repeat-like superfamily protein [Perilla frutescens var. hirtella]